MKYPKAEVVDLPWSEADLIVLNEAEARTLLKEPLPSNDSEDLVVALSNQLSGTEIVITLAERGCITLDGGTPIRHPAVEPLRVVDTTGAGDAFAATVAFQLASTGTVTPCNRQSSGSRSCRDQQAQWSCLRPGGKSVVLTWISPRSSVEEHRSYGNAVLIARKPTPMIRMYKAPPVSRPAHGAPSWRRRNPTPVREATIAKTQPVQGSA